MPVDVGSEDKGRKVMFAYPFQEQGESVVGIGLAIKIEPVPVKPPSQLGVFPEPSGVGHFLELYPELLQGWVGFPKTRGSSKIR